MQVQCIVQELQEGTDIGHILHALVEDGQLGLAQKWAQTLPQAFQISLVNQCVHVDRLKEAVKLVRHLKLQEVGHKLGCLACKLAQFQPASAYHVCCLIRQDSAAGIC